MHTMSQSTLSRVTSADGTAIAYWTSGRGRPLVLVHGATADHTRWRPLLPHLEPNATIHAVDRRGRGASGDAPGYAVDREYEDVAAVIDAVAAASGSRVDVYGHSYGGVVAFGAASRTRAIRKLILYEGWPTVNPAATVTPPELLEPIEAMLATGDREGALERFVLDVVCAPMSELEAIRAQASWAARVAAVHTVPRELRALPTAVLDPTTAARISAPTLLLAGSDSTDSTWRDIEPVRAALPNATLEILRGHRHLADVLAPELFAARVLAFLGAAA